MQSAEIQVHHFLRPDVLSPKEEPIRERMRRYLAEADWCIADLTDHNPNVFFEYGIRRASGRPVLPIIQKGKRLDFDVDDYPTTFYDLDQPAEAIARIGQFIHDTGSFQPERVAVASERITQTGLICDYIRDRRPERVDILHFSLLALRHDLFQVLRQSPDTKVRLLLHDPMRATNYGVPDTHADNTRLTAREVRILPETTTLYDEPCPTVGLWYYDHEPSIAAVMIDDQIVQLGWYLRDRGASPNGELRVHGHNQPGILLSGEAAQRVFAKMHSHFLSVWASARLADDEWGVVGPRRDELLTEWHHIRSRRRPVRTVDEDFRP